MVRRLSDYLELSLGEAREQWTGVEARSAAPEGRQVNFVPIETLLCLAASLLVNHRRYGGSTTHKAEEPVPTLARLFRRSNASVLAKMANLDGSRTNGAKHEIEVAATLLTSPGQLASVYKLMLAAARDVGIGRARLPDFLKLEGNAGEFFLQGQEELDREDVEGAVYDASARWAQKRSDLEQAITERLLVASVRIGQHRFASDVLRNHRHRCVFCGLTVESRGSRASRMLVASHIKPWRVSSDAERLDVQNGLTACPTHDVAFDTGLITVNGGMRIHVAPEIEQRVVGDVAIGAVFGRPPLSERLLLPAGAVAPKSSYLDWHHANAYKAKLAD